ncbi:MAG: efflux RND transporter permease subunit [Salinivirgaceae bacterium]|nr:efflux RND transporter permease subunit [Salinivirgaceae bacterium]
MSIYKTSINHPVTTSLIFVAVMVIGLFSLKQLPIDQFPEMDPPYVMVMTTYAGANASEIETNVSKLMENTLNSVDGLKEMNTVSKDNISVVTMEFEWGMNLEDIVNDVRSYVDMVKDNLPDGCSTPFIFKFSSSAMPIMQYAITAHESYSGLEKIIDDDIIPQLNRVNGIGNISVSGAPERYVYIDIDQEKIDAYGIPLELVGQAISSNNLNMSSGSVKMQKEQYALQVRSEYAESAEINNIVVSTTPDGKQIFVRDIATLRDTIKDLSLDEKINGRDGVRMLITKQSGANTVQICKDVRKTFEELLPQLPSDLGIEMIYDSSEEIQNAINSLAESIMYALLFVVLVVLFFLGRWRATIIIGLTIPIALIVGFIYLLAVGSSLNIISLCSLTVAIGMVVDDAIVVLENITKHIDRGSSPREAAIYATNEVWISVIATTLVIVAVFVPLTMLPGLAGILFKELGWIVTIAVCTSTTVAISLTPMLASLMLKGKNLVIENGKIVEKKKEPKKWSYENTVVRLLDKLDVLYARLLRTCLNHKKTTIACISLFFLASLLPAILGYIGTDFMQQSDEGRITVTVELQRGTRIEETLKTARKLEERFHEILGDDLVILSTSAGTNENSSVGALFSSTNNNKISMIVRCTKMYERDRTIFEMAELLRNEMKNYPEINKYFCSTAGRGMGGQTVDVEIYGYDFDQTNLLAEQIRQTIVDSVQGARDVKISREEDRSELNIAVDKEKLALHGLTSATVATYVRNRVNGMTVGFLKEDGDEYNIVVRLKEENRNSITDLENLTIPSATGAQIKLKELATVEEYWGPPQIDRRNRQRIVTVSVIPYETSLGELAEDVKATISNITIPQGIMVKVGGDYEEQQETFADMGMLLALIIMLVFIVMASQFESLKKPFIIMMAIPFAISGVIIALWVTNTTLDMVGALGVVMLVGIVVKNGIVLVDYINLMRDRGYELNEAIALSGQSRLRPVLMTAATTILGMLPMALSRSEGSEMWIPMGIVVIGGLLVSTVVTLLVVPVLYSIMSRHGERDKEEEVRKAFIFYDMDEDSVYDSRLNRK